MRIALAFSVLALAGATPALGQATLDGSYWTTGTSSSGSPYEMAATISGADTPACRITWGTGESATWANCVRYGSGLAVGYIVEGAAGVGIYAVNPDGSLEGRFSLPNSQAFGTETLTPVAKAKQKP